MNLQAQPRPRIGLDLHTLEGLHQGSRTHCLELFSRVAALMPEADFFVLVDTTRWAASSAERFLQPNVRVIDMPHGNPLKRLLWQLPGLVREQQMQLLHTQYICPPRSRARNAVTIHDILFEPFPQYFAPVLRWRSKLLFRRSAKTAELLFTVSEYSRAELAERYGIPPETIATIPNGADPSRFHPGQEGEQHVRALGLEPGQYLLTVGRLEPRKNHLGLLRAYALLPHPRLPLAIVGQKDFGYAEFLALREQLGLAHEVLLFEQVRDDALPSLYRHARLFVYPTFAEGFGMPVIEAMCSGVPVVTSNTTSLPEIAGDAARLVDPHQPEQIAEAIAEVLADPALDARMRLAGLEQARRFRWADSAATLASAYRRFFAGFGRP